MNRKSKVKRRPARRSTGQSPTNTAPATAPAVQLSAEMDLASTTYIGQLAVALTALDSAQRRWTAENEAAAQDAALLQDAGWKRRALAAMGEMASAADELIIRPLPEPMAPMDELMAKVQAQASAMNRDYAVAVALSDPKAMRSVSRDTAKLFGYINQARNLLPARRSAATKPD